MNDYESSTLSGSEISLSPPSYSVQEDPSSGDLFSRSQQLWPDRPEYGRYSLEFEYLDNKRIKSMRKRRERKMLHIVEPEVHIGRARAGGGHSRVAEFAPSDVIVPFQNRTAATTSSDQLVRTSMLFSSTSDIGQTLTRSTVPATTDDLLTLGGMFPMKSPSLVPTELLRSSCSRTYIDSAQNSTIQPTFGDELKMGSSAAYHFMGRASDEEALNRLWLFDFIVFHAKGTKGSEGNQLKVGFYVGGKRCLFPVEVLKMDGGGSLFRITGTTYSIGFQNLEDMALFYKRFPSTAE
ncbi:hypothetical protein Q1695_012758 [Nippostrongylus brasiliensis]|nr:hypothetical protein Q1695_012758 [Nippostrongylus brasiliensis]